MASLRKSARTSNRNGRKELAQETMSVIDAQGYHNEHGVWVEVKKRRPQSMYYDEFHHFTGGSSRRASSPSPRSAAGCSSSDISFAPRISVTTETAQQAAERLLGIRSIYTQSLLGQDHASGDATSSSAPAAGIAARSEDDTKAAPRRRSHGSGSGRRVAVLNFASARHPGGGFLNGAVAQEECLSRSSNLYPALLECPQFYDNWKLSHEKTGKDPVSGANVYTDRIIYTKDVSFFRDDAGDLLEDCYQVDVVTCASVNRLRRRDPKTQSWKNQKRPEKKRDGSTDKKKEDKDEQELEWICRDTMIRRAGKVLCACAENGARIVILGAWGTGVFGNETAEVALWFTEALRSLREEKKMHGIEELVFPIPEESKADEFRAALHRHKSAPSSAAAAARTSKKTVAEASDTEQAANEESDTRTRKKRWPSRKDDVM